MKHTQTIIQSHEAVRRGERKDGAVSEVGYAVQKQTKMKHTIYAPLIEIAKKQALDGTRAKTPTFIAAVASTFGELGVETIKLQEFLTNAYARKLAGEGNRDDGFSIRTLTAAYRNKFRNRMHVAIAKGVARMINTCGLPVSVCKKYRNVAINPP